MEQNTEYSVAGAGSSWLGGFVDIFVQPREIAGISLREHVAKIFSSAILLFVIGAAFQAYIFSAAPGIRGENLRLHTASIDKLAEKGKIPQEKIAEMKGEVARSLEFSFPKALGFSVILGALSIVVGTILFWAVSFMIKKEPVPFADILTLVSYGTAISCVGYIVTGLMQYFGDSLSVAPNLGWLVNMDRQPYLFSFLSRISVFLIWEYLAIGTGIAAVVGLVRSQGLMIGFISLVVLLLFFGLISYLPSLFV